MYSVHFLQPPPSLFWAYVEPAARLHLALSLSFSLLAFFFVCIFFHFLGSLFNKSHFINKMNALTDQEMLLQENFSIRKCFGVLLVH